MKTITHYFDYKSPYAYLAQEDTLALALNRWQPKYGVEVLGRRRIPPHQLEFIQHDLLTVLSESARSIGLNPRHDGKDTL